MLKVNLTVPEVGIQLSGGAIVCAVITNESVAELGLRQGAEATALIKASHIVLGVPISS